MLSISRALKASQAGTYHTQDFVSETQSYYAKGDAPLGEWQGGLADRFGLLGTVSKVESWLSPIGSIRKLASRWYSIASLANRTTRMAPHQDGGASAGWDATF